MMQFSSEELPQEPRSVAAPLPVLSGQQYALVPPNDRITFGVVLRDLGILMLAGGMAVVALIVLVAVFGKNITRNQMTLWVIAIMIGAVMLGYTTVAAWGRQAVTPRLKRFCVAGGLFALVGALCFGWNNWQAALGIVLMNLMGAVPGFALSFLLARHSRASYDIR